MCLFLAWWCLVFSWAYPPHVDMLESLNNGKFISSSRETDIHISFCSFTSISLIFISNFYVDEIARSLVGLWLTFSRYSLNCLLIVQRHITKYCLVGLWFSLFLLYFFSVGSLSFLDQAGIQSLHIIHTGIIFSISTAEGINLVIGSLFLDLFCLLRMPSSFSLITLCSIFSW